MKPSKRRSLRDSPRRQPVIDGYGYMEAGLGRKAQPQHRAAVPEPESPEDERVVRGGGWL